MRRGLTALHGGRERMCFNVIPRGWSQVITRGDVTECFALHKKVVEALSDILGADWDRAHSRFSNTSR